jgi:hypothetical protein
MNDDKNNIYKGLSIGVLLLCLFIYLYITQVLNNNIQNINGVTEPKKEDHGNSNGKYETQKTDKCKCSDSDAERLAYKIVEDFTTTQNELPSDIARVMSKYGQAEKRDNCTWLVTFKISWPFGNTDGAHPDEFVKKRLACDGKEVYVQ